MAALLALPLVDVVSALALLLAAWAFGVLIARPVAALLSALPVVGAELADRLLRGIGMVQDWALRQAATGVQALVTLISIPVTWTATAIGAVVGFAANVVGRIGDLIGGLGDLAAMVVGGLLSVGQRVVALGGQLAALAVHVAVQIGTAVQTAIHTADQLVRDAIGAVTVAWTAAVAAERALIQKVHGDVLAFVLGQVGVVITTLEATATTLRGEWASDLGGVNIKVDQLAGVLAGLTPLALPLVIPKIIEEISTMRNKCVDPMCSVITPQLSILSALLDGATILAVGALVGEAIHDPQGAARATAGAVDELHTLGADLFGAFTGAHL